MQHLTALAIEGALLDATGGDWLRDMVGLLRHGRWVLVQENGLVNKLSCLIVSDMRHIDE